MKKLFFAVMLVGFSFTAASAMHHEGLECKPIKEGMAKCDAMTGRDAKKCSRKLRKGTDKKLYKKCRKMMKKKKGK